MRVSSRLLLAPVALVALLAAKPVALDAQELRTRSFSRLSAALPPPTGVTAAWSKEGVRVSWQAAAGAEQYLVLRAPNVETPGVQVGQLAADQLSFVDAGYFDQAAYQVIAVAPKGRRGASELVSYAPPAKLALATPVQSRLSISSGQTLARAGTTAPSTVAPFITSISPDVQGSLIFYGGDTVRVTGSGLDGLTSVSLVGGYCNHLGCQINPNATPQPVSTFKGSFSGFSFVLQYNDPYLNRLLPHFLVVTKASGADTSDKKLDLGAPRPVKKILSVDKIVVRSGLRITVTGIGLDNVEGAYFGVGTPNAQDNLLYSIANRSSTSVQIMTTPTCNQFGILMLRETPMGGSAGLITGDTAMRVGCASSTPAGYILNSPSMPNGITFVLPGEKVQINGTNLKLVTRVVDQRNTSHPFTFAPGFQSVPDRITVSIPAVHPDPNVAFYGFHLENSLTDPVVAGQVTGIATVVFPPKWTSISAGWAEPGQSVQVSGSNLIGNLQVTVGGVPAQITQGTQNYVTFKLGAATTTGPIRIQNQAGAVELTGPFQGGYPVKSHPGFFVVAGGSSVTEVVKPRPAPAAGDTLVVRGQNLARLMGICLPSSGQGTAPAGYVQLQRVSGTGREFETSNTELQVVLTHGAISFAAGAVQLYDKAPNTSQYACVANPGGAQWP